MTINKNSYYNNEIQQQIEKTDTWLYQNRFLVTQTTAKTHKSI